MPLIPQEVVDRIAGGENALRVLRKWRGKTQLHISLKTNIGQGYISDLEKGRRKGTSAALKKIADVLKVPLDLIVYSYGPPLVRDDAASATGSIFASFLPSARRAICRS